MQGVMLDTSFLISLSNDERPEHPIAKQYFLEFIDRQVPMHLSTIAVCEYEVKQRIGDLGWENFLVLPFNVDDAVQAASIFGRMHEIREDSDERVAVKDDAKLIGQCVLAGVSHFVTSDSRCAARIDKLRSRGAVLGVPMAIDVRDPFSVQWFNANNQSDLFEKDAENS